MKNKRVFFIFPTDGCLLDLRATASGKLPMTEIPDGIELTPFNDNFYRDPYSVYRVLRENDPVHEDAVSFYDNSWTISDYSTVKHLLTHPALSVDPGTIGIRRDPRADNPVTLRAPDMMNLDEPDHSRLRSLVHKAFTPSSIQSFKPAVDQIISDCLDQITSDQFDVMTTLAQPVPTMVIAEYIGVDSADHKHFRQWTDALLLQGYPVPTQQQWAAIVEADHNLRDYARNVIGQRRTAPQDDLISRMIAVRDADDRFTDDEIIDMCYLLIGAGNFTTADLIGNAIFGMLSEQLAGSFDEIVEETLRYDPPAMAVRRFVTEDIKIAEKLIPRGSVINLLTGAANHDPVQFDDPDNYIVNRDTRGHLAFGRGIHHCLGAPLARLEAIAAIEAFSKRFPNARIVASKRRKRMDFRGFQTLEVAI